LKSRNLRVTQVHVWRQPLGGEGFDRPSVTHSNSATRLRCGQNRHLPPFSFWNPFSLLAHPILPYCRPSLAVDMKEQGLPRAIRALYDVDSITVYQAFNATIAKAAVRHQSLVGPFQRERMTWIKPSFLLWMMYRSGWGTKDNQTHILAIRMTRTGFESALSQATLATYEPAVYGDASTWRDRLAVSSSVRVQWDPEESFAAGVAVPIDSDRVGRCSSAGVH
jgi:Domain of unknown function (DUF4291)